MGSSPMWPALSSWLLRDRNHILLILFIAVNYSDQTATSSGNASKAQEKIESQSGCEFCGHVGIHELKCSDKKRKTNVPLNKRLDKNSRLKNFQHESYAKKRTKKGKTDNKGFQRDVKEHFVFGQNVTKYLPSEIADTLLKRDANKFYNLQLRLSGKWSIKFNELHLENLLMAICDNVTSTYV